ncbi:MAG TPA: glycosyltransferase, partial [Acidimicrobiia bacterium]|nr:glycosyltransferase [Acidimicrobiia bacterium]
MRIRHVIRGRLNPDNADGIITHTHRLARAQLQLGHDVEVYGVASRASEPEIIDRDGLVVRAFPWLRNPLGVHAALRELIETADAEATFHLQPPHDPAVAGVGRVLRRAGIPYFVSPHAMWSPHALARGRLKKRA